MRFGGSITRAIFAAGGALLTACGGGGGGSSPVSFSFSVPSGSTGEDDAPLPIQVVLHTSLASIADPASVDVADLGTGSATEGSDYAAFGTETVVFPAGSVDGAVQIVALTTLGDPLAEGADETVRLRLQNPVGGAIQSPASLTVDIEEEDLATILFTTPSSATPDEASAPRTVTIQLVLPAGVTLDASASAQVSDAGSGSATAGVDYAAFAPQASSFPAGTPDGARHVISVQVLDDGAIEIDEVVGLSLSNPDPGTILGATSLHQLTITDDDAQGSAAFVASEGPSGTENSLAFDEIVDLGSQAVGAGPNAGTRVRVTNAGGAPMDLGAPTVWGTHPNDFAVEVEMAPMPEDDEGGLALGLSVAPVQSTSMPSAGPGVLLSFEPERLTELLALTRATLHGIPLPGLGEVTLDLQRVPLPITADAVLAVDGAPVPGGPRAVLGDLSLWKGSALELPGSRVFLALSSQGARGFLDSPAPARRLVHFGADSAAVCRVVDDEDLVPTGDFGQAEFCLEPRIPPHGVGSLALGASPPPGSEALTLADCRLAIETDYQLYQRFGSTQAATNYVTQMIGAIADQYFTDVQTTFSIAYLGLYSSASDPWDSQDSGGNASDLLTEFRAAWAPPNQWPVQADLAHFLSGANLGGGVAYLDVLCNQSFGFGVSGNINGNINWSGWTGQAASFTWDFVVVAHEIGHNFGSQHTHSYCPPLDLCYTNCNNTTACSQGTIMSYCHACGGMDNIDLRFHPVNADVMRESVNSSCLGLSALAGGDFVQYLVRFHPLTATGIRNANLEFSHDAVNATQPFRIRLRGTATN